MHHDPRPIEGVDCLVLALWGGTILLMLAPGVAPAWIGREGLGLTFVLLAVALGVTFLVGAVVTYLWSFGLAARGPGVRRVKPGAPCRRWRDVSMALLGAPVAYGLVFAVLLAFWVAMDTVGGWLPLGGAFAGYASVAAGSTAAGYWSGARGRHPGWLLGACGAAFTMFVIAIGAREPAALLDNVVSAPCETLTFLVFGTGAGTLASRRRASPAKAEESNLRQ